MEVLSLWAPYLISAFICFLFVFFVGTFFYAIIPSTKASNSNWENIFYIVIIGFIIIVSSYAIIKTKGATIYILVPLLLFFLYKSNRAAFEFNNYRSNLLKKSKHIVSIEALLILLVIICFSAIPIKAHFSPNYGFQSLPGDINFYTRLSAFLNLHGIENTLLDPSTRKLMPYHYFELWLNAFFFTLTGQNSYFTFTFCTIPIFVGTLFTGISAIISESSTNFLKPNWKLVIPAIAFGLLFFNGFYFPFYGKIHPILNNLATFNLELFFPKLLPISIFLCVSFLLYQKQRIQESILTLAFIPCITIAAAPAIFGFFCITSAYHLYVNKFQKFSFRSYFIQGLCILTFYGLIYLISGIINKIISPVSGGNLVNLSENLKNYTDLNYIKTGIKVITGTIITMPFLYIPILAITILNIKHFRNSIIKREIFFIYIVINICALITWACLNRMIDAVQLFQIVFIPTTFILIHYLCKSYIYSLNTTFRITVLLLLLFPFGRYLIKKSNSLQQNYQPTFSATYLKELHKYFDNPNKVYIGALVDDPKKLNTVFERNLSIQLIGAPQIAGLTNKARITPISILDIPRSPESSQAFKIEGDFIKNSTLYRFHKEKAPLLTKEDLQIKYIEENEIDFLIVDDKKNLIEKKLHNYRIITDSLSSQKFIILREKFI